MRKLTMAQVATMTASMTASIGMITATTSRLGIPMLGLAALAHADAYGDDELEEVVVTGYVGSPWTVEIYNPGTSGFPSTGGGNPTAPTAPPIARAPTDAIGPVQRNAVRCAMHYSFDVSNTFPNLGNGAKPGFSTKFQYGAAWGATDPNVRPRVIVTTDFNNRPDALHTEHVMGWTSFENSTSFIYVDEVQRFAANPNNHVTYDENLVNTINHEWSHSWWSPRDEDQAGDIGDAAAALYRAAGGANAPCNTAPQHNGSFGGRK